MVDISRFINMQTACNLNFSSSEHTETFYISVFVGDNTILFSTLHQILYFLTLSNAYMQLYIYISIERKRDIDIDIFMHTPE